MVVKQITRKGTQTVKVSLVIFSLLVFDFLFPGHLVLFPSVSILHFPPVCFTHI